MALLTSNYNVLQVSSEDKDKYKVGDILNIPSNAYWRFRKFNGLEIKNITFGFGIFLHVDWDEWQSSQPPLEKIPHGYSSNDQYDGIKDLKRFWSEE